ncbi:polyketide cyclase/dehydrase/lipid transport protein [Stackebrandtia albiflava]|uniref:Polyketide cyclase/dehydrase/lipid transport protein n=1 Tax=Stackebrandtia albiflava TaxID=406432 RepID=A0A562VDJ7_9ACTN|nr:SRPBCC family protein [Stackebrandtia albiflava]TWJ15935.1 polyketide cyclase/dehydrase/lipid transport protein [Stackebrandtia albiflava]
MVEIRATAHTTASSSHVWAILADHTTTPHWSPMDGCELATPAPGPDPEGLGAVRRQWRGKTVGYDTVTIHQPTHRWGYTHRGLPVRDYHGLVELADTPDGCKITWSVRFTPRYPGTGRLMKRPIADFINGCATGLARHATETAGD